eukprot:6363740-Lingulodinium_polyedra.AAC.1
MAVRRSCRDPAVVLDRRSYTDLASTMPTQGTPSVSSHCSRRMHTSGPGRDDQFLRDTSQKRTSLNM